MKMNYSYNEMKLAFDCGRNFQLTGENNFTELIEELSKSSVIDGTENKITIIDEIVKRHPGYGLDKG